MQSEMWKLQPPAFSRRLRGSKNRACPKKPPERRLQARLPAPQNRQNFGRTKLAGHFRYALEAGKIALLENGRGAFQVEQEGQRERLAAIEPHGLARLALPWDPLQSIAGAAGLETVGVAEEAEGRPQPVVGDETKVAAAQVACEFGAADGTPGPGEVLRFPARAAGSQNLPVQAEGHALQPFSRQGLHIVSETRILGAVLIQRFAQRRGAVQEPQECVRNLHVTVRSPDILVAAPFDIVFQRAVEEGCEFAFTRTEDAVDVVERRVHLGVGVERILLRQVGELPAEAPALCVELRRAQPPEYGFGLANGIFHELLH